MARKSASNARGIALQVVREVLGGRSFASERLDDLLERSRLSEVDRGLCTQLVYGVLREKAYLDQVLSHYVSAAKTPPGLQNLLRLGAYQALSLNKVPDYALVNESVELAKVQFGVTPSRMVNAVLRKILGDREKHLQSKGDPKGFFPEWMLRRWRQRYSEAAVDSLIQYFNAIPPLGLRINPTRADVSTVVSELSESGAPIELLPGTPVLRFGTLDRKTLLPWLQKGALSIQDPHSYRVAATVAPQSGEKGLDACAGHGGKSSALQEACPNIELWVHEPSAKRLEALRENFNRLGLKQPRIVSSPSATQDTYDWILIDAPCSGMGTLGRKPEIRWRIRPEDLPRLAKAQRQILEEWLPRLKVGGRIIYAVCSLEPEEGSSLIHAFAAEHPEIEVLDLKEWFPGEGDGFFVANLRLRS